MIRSMTFVRLLVLSVLAAVLLALCVPVHTHADTQTSTASVSFTMPKNSAMAANTVPDIEFGSASVNQAATTDVDATRVDSSVSVTNPGFQNGWSVSVAATDFTSANNEHQIKSAQLTFDQATTATGAKTTTVTTGGDAQTLVSADHAGTVQTQYAAKAVHLHIPAGNADSDYNAQLQWTLTDAMQ